MHEIIRQIATVPAPSDLVGRKVTFVGGEPLLSPTVLEDLAYTRSLGLVTSLVTNGLLLTDDLIRRLAPALDWLTLSIDSLDNETNRIIGRATRSGQILTPSDYLQRIKAAQRFGVRVKLNTVVNRANAGEDMTAFVREALPLRWKLFQATRIAGENEYDFSRWEIDEKTFRDFVARHADLSTLGITIVPETQGDN
ncbi:MAG: radical SAM protein [Pseudolabrys sp.]|nr:radical SAM protein [Pseudolabrys sp.]